MDPRIFDQLGTLERGARIDAPLYDMTEPSRRGSRNFSQRSTRSYDHQESHILLDDFDEQLLRQPDWSSRHGQSAPGRARSALDPMSASRDVLHSSYSPSYKSSALSALHPSQFAIDALQCPPDTSSPFRQQMPSSPTFSASQRPPSGHDHSISNTRSLRRIPASHQQSRRYVSTGQSPVPDRRAGPDPRSESAHQSALTSGLDVQVAESAQRNRNGPVQNGIDLISARILPDRFRAIFPFPVFNAVQSKCFDTIYKTNDNFVLSAPTGSGKTAILELAICRLVNCSPNGTVKIIYQAPTKSLCAERHRDWQAKFGPLDLQCAELTGDTEGAQLRNVQHASIIITTPEKWDSITRKWKDHQKLMQMVRLFLIDEVHILKEDRGATLEAVVSRMKSVGSDVRFVALSATVPNSQDIAIWLGKDTMNAHLPATREEFGQEFRPVRLQKHVCGYQAASNDFAFDKVLNKKLPEVIAKWCQKKPIMIFCFTRSACIETAKLLAEWWGTKSPSERYWSAPQETIQVEDNDLREVIPSGVAFHHAGLSIKDRATVENRYLRGDVNVICCTSTLAVGVNLPCHMVVIKNTVTYRAGAAGCKEYSDLDIMQMLGRAGRPQFDNSAVAVIMTRPQRVPHYEQMITGQEILESCLHRNLIDHLNAEIGLGTINSVSTAKKWLTGTFLYVRLKVHPEHYKIDGDAPGRDLDERLEKICSKAVELLCEHDLVTPSPTLRCTEFGDAMARYYLQFDTMKTFLALPPQCKASEILSAISQASEFKEIRFRAGEKVTYKDLNHNSSIKFPIPVNLDAPAHKVSLVIQAVLGGLELPTDDQKQRFEFNAAKAIVFQHSSRLVRCIIDCQLYLEDSVATRHALMLSRSLGAQVWDDSPLHMKQLDTVGLVAVRKFVAAGINSIDELESVEAHRIEHTLSRNPPYGTQLQEKAKAFPRLRVSIKLVGEAIVRKNEHVAIKLHAGIGFVNEKVPEMFQRRPVYVCLLAETSDGKVVHFARTSAKRLRKVQEVLFHAKLTNANQSIRVYVMCEDIAGTLQHANLKPQIPSTAFPPLKGADENEQPDSVSRILNDSKRRRSVSNARQNIGKDVDEFGDEDIDDVTLARVAVDGFVDIDELDLTAIASGAPKKRKRSASSDHKPAETWEPQQYDNGKWACNHSCKDKTACKHLCCREGLDKKPKPPKVKINKNEVLPAKDSRQTQLTMSVSKKPIPTSKPAPLDEKMSSMTAHPDKTSAEALKIDRLHNRIKTSTPSIPTLNSSHAKRADGTSTEPSRPHSQLNFLKAVPMVPSGDSSDCGIECWNTDDLPDTGALVGMQPVPGGPTQQASHGHVTADAEMLDATATMDDEEFSYEDILAGMSSLADEESRCGANIENGADELHQYFGAQPAPIGGQANPQSSNVATHSGRLFVGDSSDSAVHDLGLSAKAGNEETIDKTGMVCTSGFFPAKEKPKEVSTIRPTERDQMGVLPDQILPPHYFATMVAEATNHSEGAGERASQDEVEKWFHEYLGSDLFNYTG